MEYTEAQKLAMFNYMLDSINSGAEVHIRQASGENGKVILMSYPNTDAITGHDLQDNVIQTHFGKKANVDKIYVDQLSSRLTKKIYVRDL